ncbi:MAG: tetratricopeptide repeat protein [Oscillatoria princeps RMCB-10]|jgi:tetratricopeptide (TPR) repeat protein|nr:tetratricopeptide repeat protein [Oscillatoria princeps RMCB-10]
MRFPYGLPAALIGAAATAAIISPQMAFALTAKELENLSQQITVLIEPIDSRSNSGSGVIIAREGNTYYVLTAYHVVKKLSTEYWIKPSDGSEYKLDYSTVKQLPGVDLALLQFTSERDYRVATLGDYDLLSQFGKSDVVFVSGWPAGERRVFHPGLRIDETLAPALAKKSVDEGYELLYTSITYPGMSGGPILDVNGRLIGIHGQSEGEILSQKESGSNEFPLRLGYSMGIPIKTFLTLAPQQGIALQLTKENTPPVKLTESDIIASVESLIPQPPAREKSDDAKEWVNYGNELWRLSSLYNDAGNPRAVKLMENAVAAYDKAVEKAPEFYQAWYARGNVQADLGKLEAAIESYDRSIDLVDYERALQEYKNAPESEGDKKKKELAAKLDFYATVWRYKGLMLSKLERYPEAIAAFEKVIQVKEEVKEQDFVAWDLRGLVLLKNGATEQAFKSFEKSLSINGNYPYAWIHQGEALAKMGRLDEAAAAYDRAIQIQPNLYTAFLQRGEVLGKILQDSQQAPEALDRALEIKPDDASAWHRRAFAFFGMMRRQDALSTFDRAIENNSKDAAAWAARGLTLVAENRYQEARAAFEKALEINPDAQETQEVIEILKQMEELDDSQSGLGGKK